MRVVSVPADRTASIRELRGGVVLLLAAGVELSLPKVNGDNYVALVKAAGAGCKVSSAAAGLEIGEGATSGSPAALTLTTADVTLLPGEARTYVWDGRGWLIIQRSGAPSVSAPPPPSGPSTRPMGPPSTTTCPAPTSRRPSSS